MKKYLLKLTSFLLFTQPLLAGTSEQIQQRRQAAVGIPLRDIIRSDGSSYTKVRIAFIDDSGISIRHTDGTARLRYKDLTQPQRRLYDISEIDAQIIYEKEQNKRAQYEQAVFIKNQERALLAELEAQELEAKAEAHSERLAAIKSTAQPAQNVSILPSLTTINASRALFPPTYRSSRFRSSFRSNSFGFRSSFFSFRQPSFRTRFPSNRGISRSFRTNRGVSISGKFR